jgi:hypothetical protein
MSKPEAPTPPNPMDTAQAQTGTNIGTSIANAFMNNTNQIGPNGSQTYNQSGTYKYTDPYTGKSYDIPQFTQTTSLSPAQQALLNTNNQTQQNLANLGQSQSAKLNDLLGSPDERSMVHLRRVTPAPSRALRRHRPRWAITNSNSLGLASSAFGEHHVRATAPTISRQIGTTCRTR